jgi:rhomboid family protein
MILPLWDDNTDRRSTPWVTYALIAANVLVFFGLQRGGENPNFTYAYAVVPQEILTGRDVQTADTQVTDPVSRETFTVPGLRPTPVSVYLTLLTAMFMHGGIAHLLGNMWFLFIFGDNVEDRLGKLLYLGFYLVCGVAASLAHVAVTVWSDGNRQVPCLGASGAISGVLAGYVVLFPSKGVRALVFRVIMVVPAWLVIGMWFAFQVVMGLGVFGGGSRAGGVAYGAHVGGFVAGLVLALVLSPLVGGRRQ